MGILEDSLITLENGDKIDVKELKLDDNIVLTCQIDGLNPKSVNKEAIGWSQINPIIEKKKAKVSKKWKENIDKYLVVNNNLKLSLDTIILFKDFEGETTWGYSKSLRKGYFLFTDIFEYEEIKSIKRVKGNVDAICLSVYSFSYYFVNGYLVHNTDLCGACGICWLWPAVTQPFGPHSFTGNYTAPPPYSNNLFLNTDYWGTSKTQVAAYGPPGGSTSLAKTLYSENPIYEDDDPAYYIPPTSNKTIPWNYFPQVVHLKNNISASGGAYFLYKHWRRTSTSTDDRGWKAIWGGPQSFKVTDALNEAKSRASGVLGCPWDLFWHDSFGAAAPHANGGSSGTPCYNTSSGGSFIMSRHSTSGISFYISRDKGSTWTHYNNQSGPSNIRIGSSYDGVRGDSKILVVIKVDCPTSGTNDILWRWTLPGKTLPHGWSRMISYA